MGSPWDPHPNSLKSKAAKDPKLRQKLKEWEYQNRLDASAMEEWYRGLRRKKR